MSACAQPCFYRTPQPPPPSFLSHSLSSLPPSLSLSLLHTSEAVSCSGRKLCRSRCVPISGGYRIIHSDLQWSGSHPPPYIQRKGTFTFPPGISIEPPQVRSFLQKFSSLRCFFYSSSELTGGASWSSNSHHVMEPGRSL